MVGQEDIDRRVDIYAMGVTLYAACAGVRPFRGKTITEMALAIAGGKHVALWEACPVLPASFAKVVERAMACDRAERFDTAAELAAAIRREVQDPSVDVEITFTVSPDAPALPMPRPSSSPMLVNLAEARTELAPAPASSAAAVAASPAP